MKRKSQQGVALVITLILLSVITFMAVTFLVVSRREGAQVNTLTQQSNAKFAADAAVEQAKARIMAQMLATTNGLNFGLLVSTNFVTNYYGGTTSLTDVSYNGAFSGGGGQLAYLQMLNNQLILPRPPVFIATNPAVPNNLDFRYYLDLNRNGVYDTNGVVDELDANGTLFRDTYVGDPEWIGILNHPDQRHSSSNLYVARYCFIALPIGNSLDMNYIHNQALQLSDRMTPGQDGGYLRNQGVGSWEINLAGFLNALNTNFWFYQQYNTPNGTGVANVGTAFTDAAGFVQYRYGNNFGSQASFRSLYDLFGNSQSIFLFGGLNPNSPNYIDGYSVGPVMTGVYPPAGSYYELPYTSRPWSGADNSNAFFTTQDLFNNVPSPTGQPLLSFTNRLHSAGTNFASLINSTKAGSYNRYTFYRLLSQMSFGSSAEPDSFPYSQSANTNFVNGYSYPNTPKMNLNYNNIGVVNASGAFVPLSATNFVPWTPAGFFTNAADRMLRAYFPYPIIYTTIGNVLVTNYLSITNIPIYPVNYYTPAVHRILQLAANMYDASTTNRMFDSVPTGQVNMAYPSVFAPYFIYTKTGNVTNISVCGYQEVANYAQNVPLLNVALPPYDLRRTPDLNTILLNTANVPFAANIYGVPYVVGVKKGFPNFNKFASSPIVQISRKLQIVKPSESAAPLTWHTNVQYTIGISNTFGVECWNSSATNYGRSVTIYAGNDFSMGLTVSNNNAALVPPRIVGTGVIIGTNANTWAGSSYISLGAAHIITNSFKVPFETNVVVLSDSLLHLNPPGFPPTNSAITFETTPGYFIPDFVLTVTNRVRVVLVDTTTQRVIDCVQLGGLGLMGGPDTTNDIMTDLQQLDGRVNESVRLWTTNRIPGATRNFAPDGIYNQVTIAANAALPIPINSFWKGLQLDPTQGESVGTAQTNFNAWINSQTDPNLSRQVPLVAFGKYQSTYVWSANDPMVHYMTGDLTDLTTTNGRLQTFPLFITNALEGVLGTFTGTNKYQPWNIFGGGASLRDVQNNQLAYKDPIITCSDAWQFPTNKFPNIGWLGMVHRGTPWQTVYLKSESVDNNANTNWYLWTGDNLGNYFGLNYPIDSKLSQPTNDWLLMDLFTTAPNPNASRGQLSVNQTNLAAWAAILDGVCAITNTPTGISPWFINPSDTYLYTVPLSSPPTTYFTNTLQYIVNSINAQRASVNTLVTPNQPFYPGQVFSSAGQILSVPQLTVLSPYINTNIAATLSDAVYERIPQQIMSLLRVGTPKYVIFAYGQSLKPADHSISQQSGYVGMCTNYQITGEVATRTVVRFDNAPMPGQNPTAPRAVVESFNVLPPE
jgi:hypothetical protein